MDLTITYRRWNDAIRRYLFKDSRDNDEVFLYITPDVLDEISNRNPMDRLGGYTGFENCVKLMLSSEDGGRKSRIMQIWRDLCGYSASKDFIRNAGSKNVFECALCFTDPHINQKFKCGYLNILAYALLKLNACPEEKENAIGAYLIKTIQEELKGNETGYFHAITKLFAHLNQQYPVFKDISLNGYRHVGRLRYQLILTPSQIDELRKLLFERCITTASIDNFETTVNKIHGYASENMKAILDASMQLPPYRQRIQNVFSSFDFDAYATVLESNSEIKIKGILRHALCFDDNGCRPVLLTDICNVNLSLRDSKAQSISIVAESHDRILGLNPNHVMRNGNDRFELDEKVDIRDHEIRLSTRNTSGICFLEECNDYKYYIEKDNPSPHKTIYVVVDADRMKNLKSVLNLSASKVVFDPLSGSSSELIPQVIGRNRYLFECKGTAVKQNSHELIKTLREGRNGSDIYKKGGVLHPFHKNEYLINSLPEYVFPYGIDTKRVSLTISVDGKPFCDHDLITDNDNGIIVDILDFSAVDTVRASRIDLCWKLDTKTLYQDTLYAIKADGDFNEGELRKLDLWGQPLKNESVEAFNAWGGKCSGRSNSVNKLSSFATNLWKLENLNHPGKSDLINLKTHYLINLIAAIGLSDPNMMISRSRLRECILMAAARNGFGMDEEQYIKTVISQLISMGYVLPIYGEGQTRYQVLPPLFVKSPAPVKADRRHGGDPYVWILMGCYTRGFLDYLLTHCNKQVMSVRDEESLKLVGNRIVLHHTFDPNDFSKESGYKCMVVDYDLASAILNDIPTIDDYISLLEKIPQFGVSLMPTYKSTYPRVRESSGYIFKKSRYLEMESGVFFKTEVSDPGWMALAAAKIEGRANIILTGIKLLWPTYLRLPSILERALGVMNVCQPERIKAFVIDSDDEYHALYGDYIQYGLDTNDVVSKQLQRIFGPPGKLYSNASVLLKTNLTLYAKKDRFSKAPVYALVYSLLKDRIDLVAYWFGWNAKPLIYIANAGIGFDSVDMKVYGDGALGINKVLSMLIKNRNYLSRISVLPNSYVRDLPYSLEGYHSTKLDVILKK